jgi:hypothetical protein
MMNLPRTIWFAESEAQVCASLVLEPLTSVD